MKERRTRKRKKKKRETQNSIYRRAKRQKLLQSMPPMISLFDLSLTFPIVSPLSSWDFSPSPCHCLSVRPANLEKQMRQGGSSWTRCFIWVYPSWILAVSGSRVTFIFQLIPQLAARGSSPLECTTEYYGVHEGHCGLCYGWVTSVVTRTANLRDIYWDSNRDGALLLFFFFFLFSPADAKL